MASCLPRDLERKLSAGRLSRSARSSTRRGKHCVADTNQSVADSSGLIALGLFRDAKFVQLGSTCSGMPRSYPTEFQPRIIVNQGAGVRCQVSGKNPLHLASLS